MEKRSQALLSLAKAKLSRRIAFWIFVSIVVIEAIILVPSYFRREQELLEQVENISAIQARFFLKSAKSMSTEQELISLAQSVKQETNVVGWTVINANQEVIAQKGEPSTIVAADTQGREVFRRLNDRRDRYDVAWNGKFFSSSYTLIIRHNVSFIKAELIAFVWRIIGLVAIIAVFVTASTLVILALIVILPVLKLREDLELVADSVSCDSQEIAVLRFHSMLVSRTDELGDVMGAFSQMYARIVKEIAERKQAEAIIQKEKDTAEHLLLNILPMAIADRLKRGETVIADGFNDVTVLFADIVNFTELSTTTPPVKLVCLLNEIFSAFDSLAEKYRLEKIKTIGDAYMVVGGLPMYRQDHAEAIANMALDMCQVIQQLSKRLEQPFDIRIGISTGPVVAGVIGIKKFIYDLWGDTVNVASRMESHGQAGFIHTSATTYDILQHKYRFIDRGEIMIKGKGKMRTYFLSDRLTD